MNTDPKAAMNTNTDEAALLRGVIEAPDDDLPRRVYADYIEDRGDTVRAAFIRAQCDLGRLNPAGCHTFRATGITNFLENGGTVERAQAIAAHESPRTTKLYDRTHDALTLDDIERIRF